MGSKLPIDIFSSRGISDHKLALMTKDICDHSVEMETIMYSVKSAKEECIFDTFSHIKGTLKFVHLDYAKQFIPQDLKNLKRVKSLQEISFKINHCEEFQFRFGVLEGFRPGIKVKITTFDPLKQDVLKLHFHDVM